MYNKEKYIKQGFTGWQLEEISLAFKTNVSEELIDKYLANIDYDWQQMAQVRDGLTKGIDVSIYASVKIPAEEMEIIKEKLIEDQKTKSPQGQAKAKKKKSFKIGLVFLLVVACGLSYYALKNEIFIKHTIEFQSIKSLQVDTAYNGCEFVKKIDGMSISKSMIQDNKILLDDNHTLSCQSEFVPYTIGDCTLNYKIGRQNFDLTLVVVDTTPPLITTTHEIYEIQQGDKYFDINKEISILDNYDKSVKADIKSDLDSDQDGDYTITITAIDSSKNKSVKNVLVKVLPKEVETKIETVFIHDTPITTTSQNSNNSQNNAVNSQSNNSQESQPSKPTPPANSGISASGCVVAVGTSMSDILARISVDCSSGYTVDYGEVNNSIAGSYTVYIYADNGESTTCTVTVVE